MNRYRNEIIHCQDKQIMQVITVIFNNCCGGTTPYVGQKDCVWVVHKVDQAAVIRLESQD